MCIRDRVNTVSWDDIRDKISVSAAGKTAPADVVEVDWSWVGEFQSAGWLEPLKISKEDIEDMPSIQSFMVNDEVLAVPYANDFRIAYYNTEHFKKAGIDAEPKTWDDIYNYSKKIKEDNVTKYPYAIPPVSYTHLIHWAIKSTGMEKFLDKEVMCLSGGERQRAFIAMALAQKTDILVLDEPTTYLDIYHQIQVLDIVKKLNKDNKTTVLMVLHDINQALQYSDNIIIMNEGKIIAQGRSEEVINCNIIKRVYGVNGIIKTDEDIKRSYFIPVESVCNM